MPPLGLAKTYLFFSLGLGEEGGPVGVGQGPDHPAELHHADSDEDGGQHVQDLVGGPASLVDPTHTHTLARQQSRRLKLASFRHQLQCSRVKNN